MASCSNERPTLLVTLGCIVAGHGPSRAGGDERTVPNSVYKRCHLSGSGSSFVILADLSSPRPVAVRSPRPAVGGCTVRVPGWCPEPAHPAPRRPLEPGADLRRDPHPSASRNLSQNHLPCKFTPYLAESTCPRITVGPICPPDATGAGPPPRSCGSVPGTAGDGVSGARIGRGGFTIRHRTFVLGGCLSQVQNGTSTSPTGLRSSSNGCGSVLTACCSNR